MAGAIPNRTSWVSEKTWDGLKKSEEIMLAQALPVNALNRISLICSKHNLSMIAAIFQIYRGSIDEAPPSARHFINALGKHLAKEQLRLIFKALGLLKKPEMDQYFGDTTQGKFKSAISLALFTTVGEMVIQPIDTLRSMEYGKTSISQVKPGRRLAHSFKGAWASGFTQFGTWVGYPYSEEFWSRIVENNTSIDPHSVTGMALTAFPQSAQITIPIWPSQRLKYELQVRPNLIDPKSQTSRYVQAHKFIIDTQGPPGLLKGLLARICSTALLVFGANFLLNMGRDALKAKT